MTISSEQPKIIVVGSSSIDLVLNTEVQPKPGETIMATKSESFFGGKGANQSVAASRLGANVSFIGCVGEDPEGQQVMRHLVDEGVHVNFMQETEDAATGTAYVIAAQGENKIIVVPAANAMLNPKHILSAEKIFQTAEIVLVQLESPMNAVEATYKLAKANGVKLGIYASPGKTLLKEMIDYATFIVAKINDASVVFGTENIEQILQNYPNKLFIRTEHNGTVFSDGQSIKTTGGDTFTEHKMGMGDAFTAGLAVALCHKNSLEECVKFGNEVARRVALKRGSQTALPFLKDIL